MVQGQLANLACNVPVCQLGQASGPPRPHWWKLAPLTGRRRSLSRPVKAASSGKGFGQKQTRQKRGERAPPPEKEPVDPVQLARQVQTGDGSAPSISGRPGSTKDDLSFEQRLQAIRSSVPEVQRDKEADAYKPIDYDAPDEEPKGASSQLWVKIVAGLGTVVLLGVFASSDLVLGNSSVSRSRPEIAAPQLTPEEEGELKTRVEGFEQRLKDQPSDAEALEGIGVSYAELGDFTKAASYLEQLIKVRPDDYEALRLLAETRTALGQLDKAAIAYKRAVKAAPSVEIGLLKSLADVLISDGKPGEAVDELIKAREKLNSETSTSSSEGEESSGANDYVQIQLLLGKSYSAWGKVSDSFAVYNGLIQRDPKDFRGYLAKGVLLKERGQQGESDRMFVQARSLAPESAKQIIDAIKNRR